MLCCAQKLLFPLVPLALELLELNCDFSLQGLHQRSLLLHQPPVKVPLLELKLLLKGRELAPPLGKRSLEERSFGLELKDPCAHVRVVQLEINVFQCQAVELMPKLRDLGSCQC